MNIIDVVLIIITVGIAALETRRGFGKAIFDFAALLVGIRLVGMLAPVVAGSLNLAKDTPANEAAWFAVLFALVGTLLLFLGKLAYDSTLITLDTFDPFLGGVLGLGIAVIVGHAIVNTLAIAATVHGITPEIITNSRLGMEFYDFVTYHKVMHFLSSLAS